MEVSSPARASADSNPPSSSDSVPPTALAIHRPLRAARARARIPSEAQRHAVCAPQRARCVGCRRTAPLRVLIQSATHPQIAICDSPSVESSEIAFPCADRIGPNVPAQCTPNPDAGT